MWSGKIIFNENSYKRVKHCINFSSMIDMKESYIDYHWERSCTAITFTEATIISLKNLIPDATRLEINLIKYLIIHRDVENSKDTAQLEKDIAARYKDLVLTGKLANFKITELKLDDHEGNFNTSVNINYREMFSSITPKIAYKLVNKFINANAKGELDKIKGELVNIEGLTIYFPRGKDDNIDEKTRTFPRLMRYCAPMYASHLISKFGNVTTELNKFISPIGMANGVSGILHTVQSSKQREAIFMLCVPKFRIEDFHKLSYVQSAMIMAFNLMTDVRLFFKNNKKNNKFSFNEAKYFAQARKRCFNFGFYDTSNANKVFKLTMAFYRNMAIYVNKSPFYRNMAIYVNKSASADGMQAYLENVFNGIDFSSSSNFDENDRTILEEMKAIGATDNIASTSTAALVVNMPEEKEEEKKDSL